MISANRCVHLTSPQHKILTQRWGQRQQWDSVAVVLRRFLLACQTGNFLWMSPLMVLITGAIMAYIIGSWVQAEGILKQQGRKPEVSKA